jgi:hypothetical protein
MYGITLELRKKMQIANTEASKNFPENRAEIIAELGYSLREISNIEETALAFTRECLRQPILPKMKNQCLNVQQKRTD